MVINYLDQGPGPKSYAKSENERERAEKGWSQRCRIVFVIYDDDHKLMPTYEASALASTLLSREVPCSATSATTLMYGM